MISDTGKKISSLFDMLNCETLSPASTGRLLEICRGESFRLYLCEPTLISLAPTAIEARNKQLALDLHLQLITSGANDIGVWQSAVKFLIQRLQ